MKNSEHEKMCSRKEGAKHSSMQIIKQCNDAKGKRCQPSNTQTHNSGRREELALARCQGALSLSVGLEYVPVGMILLLYSHNFDSRRVEDVRKQKPCTLILNA